LQLSCLKSWLRKLKYGQKGIALAEFLVLTLVAVIITSACYAGIKGAANTVVNNNAGRMTSITGGGF
jgi:hypothetical protein